jgi:endonuclease I
MKLSFVMMNLLKFLPKTDIYTNIRLSNHLATVEHIIPRRFFISTKHSNDILNLAYTQKYINSMRSDLKYGDLILSKNHHLQPIMNNNTIAGHIDRRRRVFYPGKGADKGLIARSITEMVYKYPYLYCYLNDIVDNPETLWKWTDENPYPSIFEICRNSYSP